MNTSSQATKPTLICKDNGPYIVNDINSLIGTKDTALTTKPAMALCRCGKSSNKPFCDGAHAKIGFSSETDINNRTADRKDTYVGEKIAIHDNRGLCAHAGICTDNLAAVFRMKKEPWIDPDQASTDQVRAVIEQCPSGALSYTIEGVDQPPRSTEALITVMPDGPYKISGNIELKDVPLLDGTPGKTHTLCRCGHSRNKPFCDGSHWSAGFKDD